MALLLHSDVLHDGQTSRDSPMFRIEAVLVAKFLLALRTSFRLHPLAENARNYAFRPAID
jgi:hypothetical protein